MTRCFPFLLTVPFRDKYQNKTNNTQNSNSEAAQIYGFKREKNRLFTNIWLEDINTTQIFTEQSLFGKLS